jgi:hypothetical protein
LRPTLSKGDNQEGTMKSVWSIPVAFALVLAGAGLAQAQQRYPAQFANQWSNACQESCKGNSLYRDRAGICPSYCTCVLEEAQAKVPLEVAIQADKDLAAKKNDTEAVKKVNEATLACQSRFQAQKPAGQTKMRK